MKTEKTIWQKSREELLQELDSTPEGLTGAEAARRLEQYGPNELQEGGRKSVLRIFLEQFADFLVIILILAAVVSAILGDVESMVVILAVITMNAVLGTVQTVKAAASLDSLKQMSAPTAKVVRDGQVVQIPGREVTVGDVVVLEAGDSICADGRLLECASLKCAESALTGESLPVEKDLADIGGDVPLGDRRNMVFSGCFVTYGRARFLVTATGMRTEMGRIAALLKSTEEKKTPLQVSLDQFGRKLSIGILLICAVLFAVSVFLRGEDVMNAFLFAVALAVAAIPEALSSIVTIVLSFGTQKMAREHAIIRRLQAVEGLGSVSVICSDKTGTLTQNKMTVVDDYGSERDLTATAMTLCSDANLAEDGTVTGEPTEAALVAWGAKCGLPKPRLQEELPRVGEAPFDSGRKMMSTIHKKDNGYVQFTKGGPDVVLERCTSYWDSGIVRPMTEEKRAEILAANKAMADKALRVLAAAQRTYDALPASMEADDLEHDLCFLGLAGMIDPVRPEVKAAIEECRQAGIRPIMITGDHIDTAVAIAKELGILEDGKKAVTGAQLSAMSDEEFEKEYPNIAVYARVQPEHKTRIVNAWRNAGYVTAMTGDGVNDAPSIKSADIGVGMGITGTDVTKNVADMVLADDNFATIVGAVEEGRRIYDNIRKAIQFLLSSNMSEVISIFVATLLGFTILEPVHLLWINLVTDCFPALALGMEEAEPAIMRRRPRDAKAGIFAGGMGVDVAYQGLVISALTIAAFFIGHFMESGVWEIPANGLSPDGTTMAFVTMSMAEIFHSLNMRSQRGSILKLRTRNRMMAFAAIGSLLATTLVCEVPFIATAFDFTSVEWNEYLVALALAFCVIPIVELVKFFQRKAEK